MRRCGSCYGVLTKRDSVCYVCGEKVPHFARLVSVRKRLTWFNNVLFMISLGFTGFSLFSSDRLPLPLSLAVSCTLLGVKFLADRHTPVQEGAVVVTRQHRPH